jgi:ribose transport system permease protein
VGIGSARVLSGLLATISTIMLGFCTHSIATSTSSNFRKLCAIAAAAMGGCSRRGEGSALGILLGILLGTALPQVLQNPMGIVGVPGPRNFAVIGTAILRGMPAGGPAVAP